MTEDKFQTFMIFTAADGKRWAKDMDTCKWYEVTPLPPSRRALELSRKAWIDRGGVVNSSELFH